MDAVPIFLLCKIKMTKSAILKIIFAIFLLLISSLSFSQNVNQSSPSNILSYPFEESKYDDETLMVTKKSYTHGTAKICLIQVKRKAGFHKIQNPHLCRAWITVQKKYSIMRTIYYDDIDAVGGSYGLFVPSKQPSKEYFFIIKCGDYDGRLFLVDKEGAVIDLIGGFYFTTKDGEFLFSEYDSDLSGFAVFNLKSGEIVFNAAELTSEIPHIYQWYKSDKGYFFTECEWLGHSGRPTEKGGVVYFFNFVTRSIAAEPIDISEIKDAQKVPYDFDSHDYPDCSCER